MSLRKFAVVLIVTSLPLTTVSGEVYSWEDENGRIHYGSKPPRGAARAKILPKTTLSKYSSNKLLKGYGIDPDAPQPTPDWQTSSSFSSKTKVDLELDSGAEKVPDPLLPHSDDSVETEKNKITSQPESVATDSEKRPMLKPVSEEPVVNLAPVDRIPVEPKAVLENKTSLTLSIEDQTIERDERGNAVAASFMILNDSNQNADGIRVEIYTGLRTVQADGPSSVPARTIGLFEVNRKDLPISATDIRRLDIRVSTSQP